MHNLPNDTLFVPSGTTVYIDGGARVYGNIFTEGAHDVNISGEARYTLMAGEPVFGSDVLKMSGSTELWFRNSP